MEKFRDYPVKKSNEMIQKVMFNLTSQEFDLLQYLIAQIKDDDTELKPMQISVADYCRVANIVPSGDNYQTIKNSLQALRDKSVWIEDDDRKGCTLVAWIDAPVRIDYGSGSISLQLSKVWEPYLLELKKRYTVTTLRDVLPMRSVYGKRLYELLLSYQFDSEKSFYREFEVDELKKILLQKDWDKKYKAFADFRLYVIEPALRDMSDYGSLDVEVEYRRMGRSYKYINFIVQRKDYRKLAVAGKNSEQYFSTKRKDTKNGKKID